MTPLLTLIGIGADGLEGLTADSITAIKNAALVVGGTRHLSLVANIVQGKTLSWRKPIEATIADIAAHMSDRVVVLASGDPFFFGIGPTLWRAFGERMHCIPAPSSLSLACARMGWAMQEVMILSLCGRELELLRPHLRPEARLLVLCADATTPTCVADYLRVLGFGGSTLHIMEQLGSAAERHIQVCADMWDGRVVDTLNMLAIEVEGPAALALPLSGGIPDNFFKHDGQFSRREVRALTLSALAPTPGELLWDIGAGSGAIGIEWMLHGRNCRAVGFEQNPERAARAMANAKSLGVPGLQIVVGSAPQSLEGLDPPDAIFVGGGGSNPGMLECAFEALRPGGRMVVNSVTLETDQAVLAFRGRFGGDLMRVAIEHADQVGRMTAYRPAMTITQYRVIRQ